ncbi:MAG: hypothetical protein JXO22_10420 [Phycisphaerae bacterium]|nr:hypothetical protein [Phycisphaerae bacterium]
MSKGKIVCEPNTDRRAGFTCSSADFTGQPGFTRTLRPARTVVNILVLAAVVAALVCALIMSVQSGGERTPYSVESARLWTIGQGLHLYARDHGDAFPTRLVDLLAGSPVTTETLQSPLDENGDNTCDYYYVTGLDTEHTPPDWWLAYSDPAYTDGVRASVLFVDGHAELLREPRFSEMLARFNAEYEAARGVPPVIVGPY